MQNSSKSHVIFIHSTAVRLRADRPSSTQGASKLLILQNNWEFNSIYWVLLILFTLSLSKYYCILIIIPFGNNMTTCPLSVKQMPLHRPYVLYMDLQTT